mgnify:CR=1 FL=1
MDRSIIIAGAILIASFLGCEPSHAGTLTDTVGYYWEEHPFLTGLAVYTAYHVFCELCTTIKDN